MSKKRKIFQKTQNEKSKSEDPADPSDKKSADEISENLADEISENLADEISESAKRGGSDSEEKIEDGSDELIRGPLIERKEPKKGVVYISRVPPFMSVAKLRDYMSQFGEVGRIYLTPEDPGTLIE